jgi:peptidoglycan/LPS O-acetylase OafA/YrhL
MATVELERTQAEIDELERLWAAPVARRQPRRRELVLGRVPRVVAVAWIAFVVAVFALEPASNPAATTPLWADVTLAAFWLALLGAALLAKLGKVGAALGGSAFAGFVGVAVGYACGATEHHLGAWWMAEAGVCGALGLLSAAALAGRSRARR